MAKALFDKKHITECPDGVTAVVCLLHISDVIAVGEKGPKISTCVSLSSRIPELGRNRMITDNFNTIKSHIICENFPEFKDMAQKGDIEHTFKQPKDFETEYEGDRVFAFIMHVTDAKDDEQNDTTDPLSVVTAIKMTTCVNTRLKRGESVKWLSFSEYRQTTDLTKKNHKKPFNPLSEKFEEAAATAELKAA